MTFRLERLTKSARNLVDSLSSARNKSSALSLETSSYREEKPQMKVNDSETTPQETAVPLTLRVAADWSWRMLVIAVAFAGIVFVISKIQIIVVPAAIAVLLAVLLEPLLRLLFIKMHFFACRKH